MPEKDENIGNAQQSVSPKQNNADSDPPASAKKGLTGKHVALILGIAAIVATAAVLVVWLLRDNVDIDDTQTPGARVVTMENVEDILTDSREKVERGMFETHMNTSWNFADSKSPSYNAVMGNAASNNYDFWFTVTLSTGEVVFTSGLIPIGTQIKEIILDEELPEGVYSAVVNINMVDENEEPVDANMGINVTLIIES